MNYKVSGRVLMTAEPSAAVPLYPVISRYSILFSYNCFARGHTEGICAREIVKSHDDSPRQVFLASCSRAEFVCQVDALSAVAASQSL